MIQYGLRLHDAEKLPLQQQLSVVRDMGFTCVHLALSKVQGMTADPSALTPGYAMYLKKAFEKAGIDIAVLGNYLNLATPDKDALKKNQEKYTAHLRFASILGVGVVGTETGNPNTGYVYDPEKSHTDEALETFITNLRPVVKDAERFGVLLAIEPVWRHIVYSPQRARIVLDEINSPNLRIIFDPVNLLDEENLDRREEVLNDAMTLLEKEIDVIHLKDYKTETGPRTCMAAGLGDMDYSAVLKFAKEKKPFIHATLENTKPENARSALVYLKGVEESV
ncbi:MAG: sugar phosphate isomerase/epimerase [Solobacterium sp.]|nr:sugar phosphate isomerase/epimerase [Solobacterium sp.]MBR2794391.1 sugar phosphate isomerase/epimerase [Solobacterium sp.]